MAEEFDPFASGAAVADASPPKRDWANLFSGLEGIDNRVDEPQRVMFKQLDSVSPNPKEARAQSLNQAFIQSEHPEIPQGMVETNWAAVRTAYAHDRFGRTEDDVSDETLYGLIGADLEQKKDKSLKDEWATSSPLGRLRMMFGSKGFGPTEVEGAVPMIGSEAAGIKGGLFTIPKMEGKGALAGLINATNKMTSSLTTPENAVIAGVTGGAGELALLAKATQTAVVARATQAAAIGTFTAIGAKDTTQALAEAKLVLADPKATDADKADAIATAVLSAAMTAAAAKGTYDFGKATLSEGAPAKAVQAEQVRILREEAALADKKTAKVLNEVADSLETVTEKPAESVPVETKVETPKEVQKKATVEELDNGGFVVANEKGELIDYAKTPEEAAGLAKAYEGGKSPEVAPETLPAPETPKASAKQAVVGIKNASVDEAFTKMGMEPPAHGEKLSFEQARKAAAEQMEADPNAGAKLVRSLDENPRPVTGRENALLLHELTRLTNERAAAEKAYVEAVKMGDTVEIESARTRVQQAQTDFIKAAEVDTRVGTENAIGLALRRMLMQEDYSLARMEQRRMVANEGKPLSEAQRAEVVEMHSDIAAKEAAMLEAKKPRKPREKGIVLKFINERASEARARIEQRRKEGRAQSGLDPADLADHAIVGAEYIAKGTVKLAEWSEAMVKEFGDAIKPHLKGIFDKANSISEDSKIAAELEAKTARINREIKRLEDAIKNGGKSPEDKTGGRPSIEKVEALEQRRDELRNELNDIRKTAATIEELQAAIAEKKAAIESGEVKPEGANAFRPSRQEIEVLRQERDALNERIAEMRKKPEPTLEEKRLRQIEGQIAKIENQLESGEIFPPGEKPKPTSPAIKAALDKLDALKYERDNLRESLQPSELPKTKSEKRLDTYKRQRVKATEELNRRIKEGDFKPKPKPEELHLDEEANLRQAEYDIAKLEFERALEKDRYEKLSPVQKAGENAVIAWDSTRAILAGFEFSAVGRQGAARLFSNPIQTLKSMGDAFRALVSSEEGAHAINLKVLNDPEAKAARANKLALIDERASLNKQEEIYMGKLVGKIPGVKNFERFAHVFLNKVRLDMWKEMRTDFPDANPRLVADFINSATGRGSLGRLESSAVLLNRALFSPRFLASRIQSGSGYYIWKAAINGDRAAVKAVSKQYAKTMVGYAAILSALYYGVQAYTDEPVSISTDPKSSDFLKLKVGNTRLDMAAGVQQPLVFLSRLATKEKTLSTGKTVSIEKSAGNEALRFGRSKLNPSAGKAVDFYTGTNMVGEPATVTDLLYPATYSDILEAFKEHDIPEGTAIAILALFGVGVQTYEPKKPGVK